MSLSACGYLLCCSHLCKIPQEAPTARAFSGDQVSVRLRYDNVQRFSGDEQLWLGLSRKNLCATFTSQTPQATAT